MKVLPMFWVALFGVGTLCLWLGVLHGKNGVLPPNELKYVFSVAWCVGVLMVVRFCDRLKRVCIDSEKLYVSNFGEETSVPFNEIREVKQNLWINIQPVTICFRAPTVFGDSVTFMPERQFRFQFWRPHPIVSELKRLAGLEK